MLADATWRMGDFNADDKVDSTDFGLLISNYGASQSQSALLGATVPEPTFLGGLAILGLLLRREKWVIAGHRKVLL